MPPVDLSALLGKGTLDAETVRRLKAEDPEQIRAMLLEHLPEAEVDAILARIRALIQALDRP